MALDRKTSKGYRKAWNGELGWPAWFRECVHAGHVTNLDDVLDGGIRNYRCLSCARSEPLAGAPSAGEKDQ